MSISFICINVEGGNLNTVILQVVHLPIILIGLLISVQRGLYEEYVVQFEEKNKTKPTNQKPPRKQW